MSVSMAIKCASSGLGLHHLQLVYHRGKEEGVKQVLMERFDNKPRVSSNKRVLAQICQYFIDNANEDCNLCNLMFCKTNIDSVGVGLVANKNAYSNSERVYINIILNSILWNQ